MSTTTTTTTTVAGRGRDIMRGGNLLSHAIVRQVAAARTGVCGSHASPIASSSLTSTASLAAASAAWPATESSTKCLRHQACFSTRSIAARPQKTKTAKAPEAAVYTTQSSSMGQVPSFDAEHKAFAIMSLRETQADRPHQPESAPVQTRKERRKELKLQRKRQQKAKEAKTLFGKAGLERKGTSPFVREDGNFRTFKPITPSIRWVRQLVNPHVYTGRPINKLTMAKLRTGGRNHHGRVTVRGRGGGNRPRIRIVDWMRTIPGLQTVLRIERDPNRSAHIALIEHNETKSKSYILAPDVLRAGDTVESYRQDLNGAQAKLIEGSSLDLGIFRTKAVRPGNVLPLRLIPIGTIIHAITLRAEGSAKLVRSAGAYGQVVAFVNRSKASKPKAVGPGEQESSKPPENSLPGSARGSEAAAANEASDSATSSGGVPDTTHVQVRLQSGEVRLVPITCTAAIGRVSNSDHEHERLGKAGRSRWLGRKPKVRGVAMNAVDHPHGGGRGKSKSNKHPRSIYGWKTKGPRTRKPGTKNGNRMVVRERPRMNGKRASKA